MKSSPLIGHLLPFYVFQLYFFETLYKNVISSYNCKLPKYLDNHFTLQISSYQGITIYIHNTNLLSNGLEKLHLHTNYDAMILRNERNYFQNDPLCHVVVCVYHTIRGEIFPEVAF